MRLARAVFDRVLGPVAGRAAELVFRPQCAACGVLAEAALCRACRGSLMELGPACPRCAEPITDDARCRRCATWPLALDGVIAPWRFGGQLASAIRRLKFAYRPHIARDLAPLWAPVLAAAAGGAAVVPVPLHWRRRLARGYDHAWLLAHHACALARIAPPVAALRRTRHVAAQSTLPASERAANLAGVFAVRRAVPGPVVLVDDVMTTGATLAAAAAVLRAAGAGPITALVLARATSARE
jgi:ComF family protein